MMYVAYNILARLSIKLIKGTPENGAGALYVSLLTFTDQIFAKSRSTFRESGWSGGQVFMYRWLEESWIDTPRWRRRLHADPVTITFSSAPYAHANLLA